MIPPELHRPIRIDTLGDAPRGERVIADAAERAALARRFDLLSIERLDARAEISRAGAVLSVGGRLEAEVTQSCVASGEPVPARIAEDFALRFVPETADKPADEIELDEAALDTIAYSGGAIDLGEAIAQTLTLALDPFPRAPDADAALRAAGVVSEEEAAVGPFAGLRALRDRL